MVCKIIQSLAFMLNEVKFYYLWFVAMRTMICNASIKIYILSIPSSFSISDAWKANNLV